MITLYFKKLQKDVDTYSCSNDDSKSIGSSSSSSSTSNTSSSSESVDTKINKGNFELTQDQHIALQELLDFITNPKHRSEKFYLLTGSAGTGKTFLVSYLYSVLKSNYNIAFTASTNKAVNVLQATYETQHKQHKQHKQQEEEKTKGEIEKEKEVNFYTIHRFMNSNRAIDKNGEAYFKFSEGKRGKISDIVFVDEISMIPSVLAAQIEVIKKYKKVILIGDRAQLPPVNEIESSLFSWKINSSNLNEIVRYRNNIVKLANQLKNLIFNKKNICLASCRGDGVFLYRDNDRWLEEYYKDTNNSVVLAYTNDRVRTYNDSIRKRVIKINSRNRFEANEKIMFNNFYNASSINEGGEKINYYTSYQINIKSCREDVYIIDTIKILETMRDDLVFQKQNPIIADTFIESLPNNIPIYYLVTEGDYLVNNPIDFKGLSENLEKVKNEFIRIKTLFSDTTIREFWDFYYNSLIDKFADVTYGYAMTVHKSQGSTYNRVFVDMKDIIKRNPKERESYQCLYTAVTRAAKEIHLFY
jgi:hypothetical protein